MISLETNTSQININHTHDKNAGHKLICVELLLINVWWKTHFVSLSSSGARKKGVGYLWRMWCVNSLTTTYQQTADDFWLLP